MTVGALNVPAAPSLSEWAIWIVASIRITTVFPRSTSATFEGGIAPCRSLINAQTRRRVFARAAAMCRRWVSPIASKVRHAVGSEATGP
jgi:hypothetical protein